ncbi:MAG TPA: phage holin family protein [Planctomycetota bacterium]|nr:phage holin family protein [Planctomycetota bacterium]
MEMERQSIPDTPAAADSRSLGSLFRDLFDEAQTLVRQEVDLAKAEMSEKTDNLTRGGIALAISLVVLLAGSIILLGALAVGLGVALGQFMDPEIASWLGPLIVGALTVVAGVVTFQAGRKKLSLRSLKPQETLRSLQEDKAWLTNEMREQKRELRQDIETMRG